MTKATDALAAARSIEQRAAIAAAVQVERTRILAGLPKVLPMQPDALVAAVVRLVRGEDG